MDNTVIDLAFPAVSGREVVSRNDGDDITSDAGLLLVALADNKPGRWRVVGRLKGSNRIRMGVWCADGPRVE